MNSSDSDVALVIIYNHQYNKNIEILESLYKHRFSHIFHLVPFYQGERENVIPVYENSYHFQGYLAQVLKSFFHPRFVHYFFVADDLLLHPSINERNYRDVFHVESKTCFLPGFIPDPYEASMNLHDSKSFWNRIGEAYHWQLNQWGVEVANQISDKETALKRCMHLRLSFEPLRFHQLLKVRSFSITFY